MEYAQCSKCENLVFFHFLDAFQHLCGHCKKRFCEDCTTWRSSDNGDIFCEKCYEKMLKKYRKQ